jgi:hypothetical protein
MQQNRKHQICERAISWQFSGDPIHPYTAQLEGAVLVIRMNDFPEEPLYTLLIDDQEVADFDTWPHRWRKPVR